MLIAFWYCCISHAGCEEVDYSMCNSANNSGTASTTQPKCPEFNGQDGAAAYYCSAETKEESLHLFFSSKTCHSTYQLWVKLIYQRPLIGRRRNKCNQPRSPESLELARSRSEMVSARAARARREKGEGGKDTAFPGLAFSC